MLKSLFVISILALQLLGCASKKIIKDKPTYQSSVKSTLDDNMKEVTVCEEIYAKYDDLKNIGESVAEIDLFIRADGSVSNVFVVDKDISHPDVSECMVRKIKKIKFEKHGFGELTEIRSSLTLKKLPMNHKSRNTKAFWPNE